MVVSNAGALLREITRKKRVVAATKGSADRTTPLTPTPKALFSQSGQSASEAGSGNRGRLKYSLVATYPER